MKTPNLQEVNVEGCGCGCVILAIGISIFLVLAGCQLNDIVKYLTHQP